MHSNQGHVSLLSHHFNAHFMLNQQAGQDMNAIKNEILDLDSYQLFPIYPEGENQQYAEQIPPVSVIQISLQEKDYQQAILQDQGVPDRSFHCSIQENPSASLIFQDGTMYPEQWFQNQSHENHNHGFGVNGRPQEVIGIGMNQQLNAYKPFGLGSSSPSDLAISSTQVSSSSAPPPLEGFKKEANWDCNEPERPNTLEMIEIGMNQQSNAYTQFGHGSSPPSNRVISSWQVFSSSVQTPLKKFPKGTKTFICIACNRWFTSPGHVNRHYTSNLHKNTVKSSGHPDPASPPISMEVHPPKAMDSIAAEFSQCPDKFVNDAEEAKVDIKIENTSYQVIFSPGVSEDFPPTCRYCQKTFVKACYLTQHNKAIHSGEKPFKCIRCGKRFSCDFTYQEHLGKHVGDKPHKCKVCPKQFIHRTDLKRHIILHTGPKPHVCETCGKGFIRKDHLRKHYLVHSRKGQSKVTT